MIVEGQVIARSFCHAGSKGGSRGGATEANGLTGSGRAHLVKAGVDRAAEFYFRKGIAGTTAKRYAGAWRRYAALCHSMGKDPLPATEEKVIAYILMLA